MELTRRDDIDEYLLA